MDLFETIILSVTGLLFLFIGGTRTADPIRYYERNSGIPIANDVDLLSEVRGASGVMLLAGTTALIGAFLERLTTASLVVATVLFLGFAVGRLLSLRLDGRPNGSLIQGLIIELVLGGLTTFALVHRLG